MDPTLASHPVHLINNKDNSIFPSALVPFCAFNSKLSISTPLTFLPEEEFPICTSFLPTSLDSQRCYKLNLNATSWEGRRNGLVLLLDMNEERSVNHIRKENGNDQNVDRTIIGLSAKLTHLSSIFVRPLLCGSDLEKAKLFFVVLFWCSFGRIRSEFVHKLPPKTPFHLLFPL